MRLLPDVGLPELLLILVIVMMVFGVGKLPEIGGALGKGIREFRRYSSAHDEPETPMTPPPTSLLSAPAAACHHCGRPLIDGARFCSHCGTPVMAATTMASPAATGLPGAQSQTGERGGKTGPATP